jgi:hypothetical protein
MLSAEISGWSQVTSSSAGRYNSALRSQVTPSAELNIAVQYLHSFVELWYGAMNTSDKYKYNVGYRAHTCQADVLFRKTAKLVEF